ncbi:MAG: tyrosine--tRNA ligase [Patescibacteria group bacterium]|jgi:tyrosyl-tRNA synthetase
MSTITDKNKIEGVLTRGVDTIYPNKKRLEEKMRRGERLTLYFGVDPTGFDLHIGHSVPLRKLAQFQQLGHRVILLIGDFTGMIGDPSGKDKTRKPLTREQVLKNAKDYKRQAAKILDFDNKTNPIEIKFNSSWLAKLTLKEVVELAANFTVQQMIERDMFERRIKEHQPISLHEFLYPLMQGYDSVAMNVDMEIGGSDQTFNMLAGRTLMDKILHKEKFVLSVPLLTDSRGVKIGKTEGNIIAICAEPNDLYGKIMALGDDVIIKTFEYCTDVPMEKIHQMEKDLKTGLNPKDYKARLAYEIVKIYSGEKAAQKAGEEFKKQFAEKKTPTEIPEVTINGKATLLEIIKSIGLASSGSESKRLIEQKGIKINGKPIVSWKDKINFKIGDILQRGRKFKKIKKII